MPFSDFIRNLKGAEDAGVMISFGYLLFLYFLSLPSDSFTPFHRPRTILAYPWPHAYYI